MAQIGKSGTHQPSNEQTKVYGVCNRTGSNFGDRYKISSGEFLGTLSRSQVSSNCSDGSYDCSNAWCKSGGAKNTSLAANYNNQNDQTNQQNRGDEGSDDRDIFDKDYNQSEDDNTNNNDDDGIKGFADGATQTADIDETDQNVDTNREQDFFDGEYDESTNNPNKTYKNTYWINKTKDNQNIPKGLRDRFWTHIQAGFLTEQDKKTNYNVRAIGDDDYPQVHFGKIDDGIDESDVEFIGDISEYNSAELIERVLENSYHRINTVYREYRKEIVNLSGGDIINEKTFEGYFNNPQTKIFKHNFDTRNVSVNFFSNSSNTSMDSWTSISYKILNSNEISVTYDTKGNNGHSVLTTINNLSESSDDDVYEVGNLKEGYIYKPHYKIKIREFDSTITFEEGSDVNEIPSYATLDFTRVETTYDDSGTRSIYSAPTTKEFNTYKYRRLLDIGETDILGLGVDYPFNSGAHYIYLDSRFYLQRQDPPFDSYNNEVELKVPTNVTLLNYLVKSPNYLTFKIDGTTFEEDSNIGNSVTSDVIDGDVAPIDLSVILKEYEGNYSLGDRYISGSKETDTSTIITKDLDDVC